jgi:subtilisin family serine protease
MSGKNIIHLRSEHKSTNELIRELSSAPGVENVSRNHIRRADWIPNDPYYSQQWGTTNIKVPYVWDYTTGSNSVYVAVFDSGIDYNHPDLIANMGKDSYGNYGRRFYNRVLVSNNPMDDYGHGTHVAGIIGAVGNNGIGVAGVCWSLLERQDACRKSYEQQRRS